MVLLQAPVTASRRRAMQVRLGPRRASPGPRRWSLDHEMPGCTEHGIHPETELTTADGVDDAWEQVLRSDVHYWLVFDAASFAACCS